MSDLHRFAVRNATVNMQTNQEQRTPTASAKTTGASHDNNTLAMPAISMRPELEHSHTWPTPKSETSMEAIAEEDEIDQDPQQHFLSPVQPYEWQPWSDDDDDDDWDGSEVQWDAGITDFALFDNDRREADERKTDLPSKWHNVAYSQEHALQRSLRRTASQVKLSDNHLAQAAAVTDNSESDDASDELPNLTPDTSPDLRDLGDEFPDPPLSTTHALPVLARPQSKHKRNYRTVEITPALPSEASIQEEDELPLSFETQQSRVAASKRPVQRPGLRHARTLSGRRHSWRKPSWEIYALEERAEEETEVRVGDGQNALGEE